MLENDALKLFKKSYPGRTVKWITFYEGVWYVIAIDESDRAEGSMNPYFSVDPTSGTVGEYSPTLDLEHFNALVSSEGRAL